MLFMRCVCGRNASGSGEFDHIRPAYLTRRSGEGIIVAEEIPEKEEKVVSR